MLPHLVPIQSAAIVLMFAVGSWSGSVAERHFRTTDPGPVVIDEVMGMLITLFMNPAVDMSWSGAFVGFLLFRVFDIIKPYPARRLEKLPGGIGIMADDAMAAIYANVALRGILILGKWVIG
jgi:phosphatidylglycerophosphatase A